MSSANARHRRPDSSGRGRLSSHRTNVTLTATLMFMCVCTALFGLAGSAAATDLSTAVTSVSIEQSNADLYGWVTVDISFAAPAHAKVGDTFTVNFPSGLYIYNQQFQLVTDSGDVVAGAAIHDGVLRYTLNSYITTHSKVHGDSYIEAHFNSSVVVPNASNTFAFTSGTHVFHDSVLVTKRPPVLHSNPVKYGYWIDPSDQGSSQPVDAAHWQVFSRTGPQTDLVFNDTLGPGQINDCSSVSIVSSKHWDSNGQLISPVAMGSRAKLTCSANSFTVDVASTADGEVVRIAYASSITDLSYSPYVNACTVSIPQGTVTINASIAHYVAYGNGNGGPLAATTSGSSPTTTSTGTTTSSAPTQAGPTRSASGSGGGGTGSGSNGSGNSGNGSGNGGGGNTGTGSGGTGTGGTAGTAGKKTTTAKTTAATTSPSLPTSSSAPEPAVVATSDSSNGITKASAAKGSLALTGLRVGLMGVSGSLMVVGGSALWRIGRRRGFFNIVGARK